MCKSYTGQIEKRVVGKRLVTLNRLKVRKPRVSIYRYGHRSKGTKCHNTDNTNSKNPGGVTTNYCKSTDKR